MEASLVLPIIMGIIIFFIFLLFFLNGRVIISSKAYGGAIYAASLKEGELEAFMKEYNGFKVARSDIMLDSSGSSKLVLDKAKLSAIIDVDLVIPMPFISSADNSRVFIRGNAVRDNAVPLIRKVRMVKAAINVIEDKNKDLKNNGDKK